MKNETSPVVQELRRIAEENDGVLNPVDVVEAARPATSPLHSRFQWNNSVAAELYRLHQARNLIRVMVTIIPGLTEEPEKVWVSLREDRNNEGGYRFLTDVLSDSEMREKLLVEAYDDMQVFSQKYARLEELSEVIRSMRKVRIKDKARQAVSA